MSSLVKNLKRLARKCKPMLKKRLFEGFLNLLLDVYKKFLKQKGSKKVPSWARELKEIIPDRIDTNLTLTLKEISRSPNLHRSYLSREFSKYFDNLTFGDYIRKLRIEKAIELLKDSKYWLAEIACLTGFSDQSHFNRIFKGQIGENPSVYRKNIMRQ
jgi:AraC-like DNA-binding protein